MSKDKYNETFDVVKQAINEWDPIGVLPHAPDDEYEFEVAKVVTLLNKSDVDTVENLSNGIAMIFKKTLEWDFSEEECLPIAKKIWRNIYS